MKILKGRQTGHVGFMEELLIDELHGRIFNEPIRMPTTIPGFKDMSWIEKEMFSGQHIYYVDDNGIITELDPREVIVPNQNV